MFVIGYLQEEKQKHYNCLLADAKKDLEVERQTITQLNFELSEFRRKYEETQKEVEDLNQLLCSQRKAGVQHLEDDRLKAEKIQRLKVENDLTREKLEKEKKRSEELLSQVSPTKVCRDSDSAFSSWWLSVRDYFNHQGGSREQNKFLPSCGKSYLEGKPVMNKYKLKKVKQSRRTKRSWGAVEASLRRYLFGQKPGARVGILCWGRCSHAQTLWGRGQLSGWSPKRWGQEGNRGRDALHILFVVTALC